VPIVTREEDPLTALATGELPTARAPEEPGVGAIFAAAFRQNNLFGSYGSMLSNFAGTSNQADASYNAWDEIKGTEFEDKWQYFATSNNSAYTSAMKAQLEQEVADRRTLEAGGWTATLANFGAAVVDPTILIPVGGEIIKGAQGAYKFADVALRSSLAAGLSTTAQEAGLHASQELRTAKESAYAIGGAVVLGGLLGGAVSAALSKADRAVSLKGYDALLPVEGGGGLSSAPARAFSMDDLTVEGTGGLTKATQFLNPNLRLNQSPSPLVREVAQGLAENTLYQAGHAEGVTVGAAVERLAKMSADSRMAGGVKEMREIFGEMRKVDRLMSFDDFSQAVGRAMRNGDEGENEFVNKAAKAWRGTVVEPFFQEGKATGLYDEGDDVSFAKSYFPRQYRTKVLIAKEPEIKAEWSGFMERRIIADYENARQRLKDQVDEMELEARDLKLTPKQREQAAMSIETERQRLASESPEHVDRFTQVEEAKARADAAIAAGDKAAAKAAKEEVKKLRANGGKEYRSVETALKKLSGRGSRLTADKAGVKAMAADIAARRAQAMREFFDTWEIRKLGENIDPFDPGALPNFKELAKETIDEVYEKLTGRDYGASSSVAPEYMTPIARGPVKERTLPIPDWMLQQQGVLEDDVLDVMHRYSRTLAADVELTRKFGDPRLDGPLQKIAEQYAELRKGVTDPKQLADIQKRQKADQRDLEALRDLIRGTYKANENGTNFARTLRTVGHFNFIRHMGGVVISSFSDLFRPAMVMGMRSFMGDGIAPLLRNSKAVGMSVHEAQLAGTVVERALAHRLTTITGIADPLERGTPVERFMANLSRVGGKWSGLNLWNDTMQSITSVMTQNNILGGRFGTRQLAYLGIDGDMAIRVKAQYATHGEMLDGVHVANTEAWDDPDAIRAFRAAVGKEVDRVIVNPSVGDVPLFARTPLGRLIFQFRSFMIASHGRVLLAGMQENKANFAMGAIAMTSMGMLSAYLAAWRGGRGSFDRFQEKAQNPMYVVGEGLDRSGIFSLAFDFSNTTEKVAGPTTGFSFNPLKYAISMGGRAFDPDTPVEGESQRFATRGPAGAVLGPSFGLLFEDVPTAARGGFEVARGGEMNKGQRRAATSLIPFNSFLGMREAVQALNGDSPYLEPAAAN
jgi:hypothetical protein